MNLTFLRAICYATNITCIIFLSLIIFVYFYKNKIKNTETNIYDVILSLNIVSLIVELLLYISTTHPNSLFQILSERSYYIFTVLWMCVFTIYNIVISRGKNDPENPENISYKKKKMVILISGIVIVILMTILPIESVLDENGEVLGSTGPAPAAMFLISMGLIITNIITVIVNKKRIEPKKKMPLYLFIVVIAIEIILKGFGINIFIITLPMTIVSVLMYHTIENPDVKMLEEVSIAKEGAEKANQAKTEFLSNMSHEIRTPLNAIVGFSESLKDDNVPTETREKINDIITASNNLLEIVNGILDISKIEANKIELINREYDIKSTLDELESLTRARIGEKGLELNVKIDPTLPRVLYGDNVRLKQVILNILTNAVKYTKEGHIDFVVSSVIKDNMCRLIISVEDTGIGIKQENISKLFSKFERLDVEKQLTIEGTGLGLAITKKLVDLMGGTIVAQSVYGEGSKFTISVDQKIISVKPIEKEKPVTESKILDVSGARALIVDDNELNIKVASTLLKKYNFTIESASGGQECINMLLKDDNYDIIFLDDMMPRMSGRDVIKKLRKAEDFNVPTIALTANAIEGMKEEYLECGFDDYLAKPIEKTELERVIRTYLSKFTKESVKSNNAESIKSALPIDIEIPEDKPKEEKKPIKYQNYSGKNILIVDDSDIELKVTSKALENYNFKITKVRSGSECIVKVIDKKYDIIFMDDKMPKLSGVQTVENIEQIDGFNSKVVLLTNATGTELESKLKNKNIVGALKKPINKEELNKLLKEILQNKGDE